MADLKTHLRESLNWRMTGPSAITFSLGTHEVFQTTSSSFAPPMDNRSARISWTCQMYSSLSVGVGDDDRFALGIACACVCLTSVYGLFCICNSMVLLIQLLSRLLIRSVSMLPPTSPVSLLHLRCDWCADLPDQPDQPDQGDRDVAQAVCRYVATHPTARVTVFLSSLAYTYAISLISLISLIHATIRSCCSWSMCPPRMSARHCSSCVWRVSHSIAIPFLSPSSPAAL